MAVLAFAALGAFIAPVGYASIGWAIGAAVGNMLFPPKGKDQNVQGPRFSDLKIQSSAYGQMIPYVAGQMRLAGNIIWANPIREVVEEDEDEVGGKGGGGSTVTNTTYRYFADFAILICEGPADAVTKVWINQVLNYNVTDTATSETVASSGLIASSMRFYPGTETQTADPLIVAAYGNLAPAYRGSCYVVFENFEVTKYNGRIPQMEFEVFTNATTTDLQVNEFPNLPDTYSGGAGLNMVDPVRGLGNVTIVPSSGVPRIFNFPANTISKYYPTGFVLVCSTPDDDGIVTSGSATITVYWDDGNTDVYTGGLNTPGTRFGYMEENERVVWMISDISGTFNSFYRVELNSATGTYTYEAFTGTNLGTIFFLQGHRKNVFDNKVYGELSNVFGNTPYVGYLDLEARVWVNVFDPGLPSGFSPAGSFCALITSAGYIWMLTANPSTSLQKRNLTGTVLGTVTLPAACSHIKEDETGLIWAGEGSAPRRCFVVHPTTLTVINQSELHVSNGQLIGFTDDNRAVLLFQPPDNTFHFGEIERTPRVTGGTVALSEIVANLCSRVGLEAADIDVSQLTDLVGGYVVSRRDSVRSALAPLQIAYLFDAVESDNKIKFIKRGGSSVVSIPPSKLAARRENTEAVAVLSNVRRLETELPNEVSLNYYDIDASYETGTQYARRLIGSSEEVATLDLPIAFTSSKAVAVAEAVLYERWASRNSQVLSLPREYLYLQPGDVFTITTSNGNTLQVRAGSKSIEGQLLEFETVTENIDAYEAGMDSVQLPDADDSVGMAGPTIMHLLDIPALRDEDDDAGIWAAVAGYFDGWTGATIYKSTDGGATYNPTVAFTTPCIFGTAQTSLPNFLGGNLFDEASTLSVTVNGTLSSATEDEVYGETNAAYYGGELIKFKNATLTATNGDNRTYTLSGFLRGQKGTEQYMSTHIAGERFVLLNSSIRKIPITDSGIGTSMLFKAVSSGQHISESTLVSFIPQGVALKPLSPSNFGGGRTAAASYDIIINWKRRARISTAWRNNVETPLDEATEDYVVEIYSDGTYTTLKRTITTTASANGSVVTAASQTANYKSADQVLDFGANQALVYYRIYQISARVGRGFALTGSV